MFSTKRIARHMTCHFSHTSSIVPVSNVLPGKTGPLEPRLREARLEDGVNCNERAFNQIRGFLFRREVLRVSLSITDINTKIETTEAKQERYREAREEICPPSMRARILKRCIQCIHKYIHFKIRFYIYSVDFSSLKATFLPPCNPFVKTGIIPQI